MHQTTSVNQQVFKDSFSSCVNGRRTMDDGHQPIAIDHLSDSGDLKYVQEWLP